MEYSEATAQLLERMDKVVLRQEYVFKKQEIRKLIKQIYELFDLEAPERIEWCVDITDKKFKGAAWVARAARAAEAARAARAARAAGAAWAAWVARAARAAEAAGAAWAAWAARAARAAGAARAAWVVRAAWVARAAVDYDHDYFVIEHEWLQDKNNERNENDEKFLKYGFLTLEAKEAGLGYYAEKNGVLYCCPNPIISLNERLQYHSTVKPAVYWKDGLKLYYLSGVSFDYKLWRKVTGKGVKAEEIFKIENMEQRRAAYEIMDKSKMKELTDYVVLNKAEDDLGKPMQVIQFKVDGYDEPFRYLQCVDASTDREYFLETQSKKCWKAKEDSFGVSDVEWVKEW